jgi:myosin heavy subunit
MYMCTAIHRTVSAVLQLGNMQFKEEKNQDQATMPDDTGTLLVTGCLVCSVSVTFLLHCNVTCE